MRIIVKFVCALLEIDLKNLLFNWIQIRVYIDVIVKIATCVFLANSSHDYGGSWPCFT